MRTSDTIEEKRVYLDLCHFSFKGCRNLGSAQLRQASKGGIGLNGHDARDDRDSDALCANFLLPSQEAIDIVEELGNNKVSTAIDFCF